MLDFARLYVFILQHASLRANDRAERLLDRAVGVVRYKLRELPQRSRYEVMERPAPAVKRPQLKQVSTEPSAGRLAFRLRSCRGCTRPLDDPPFGRPKTPCEGAAFL